jgi:hypothetical protein
MGRFSDLETVKDKYKNKAKKATTIPEYDPPNYKEPAPKPKTPKPVKKENPKELFEKLKPFILELILSSQTVKPLPTYPEFKKWFLSKKGTKQSHFKTPINQYYSGKGDWMIKHFYFVIQEFYEEVMNNDSNDV